MLVRVFRGTRVQREVRVGEANCSMIQLLCQLGLVKNLLQTDGSTSSGLHDVLVALFAPRRALGDEGGSDVCCSSMVGVHCYGFFVDTPHPVF